MTAGLDAVTAQTLEAVASEVQKAQTQGYTIATGLQGYDLEGPAKSLFPVLSPFRNMLPRKKAPVGSTAAHWKAITGINVTNANPFPGFGYAGNLVSTTEQDYSASYQPIGLGDSVQMDAERLAQGFDNLRARAGTNLLYALMIAEDRTLLGSQSFALQTPGAATLTPSSTGGSIGAITLHVKCSARTIWGYFTVGGTVLSADANSGALTGTTNQVTAKVTGVQGAAAYDWYLSSDGTNFFYRGTTTSNTATFTSFAAADLASVQTPAGTSLPGVDPTVPTAASRATDSSANANAYNGLMATLAGDYSGGSLVTHGGGTASGAYFKSLDGATLTGSNGGITEIDDLLQNLWDYNRIGPTRLLVNSQQHRDITRKVIQTGGAYTVYQPDNVSERQGVVGGQLLTQYLNVAMGGAPVRIDPMPHLPAGTIIAVSESLPYPSSNIDAVLSVETQQEYQQLEYAMSRTVGQATGGPRYDFEVRAIELLKNYFPGGFGVLSNIAAG